MSMGDQKTLARPYAKAVFEFALANKKLALWSENLHHLSAISAHELLKPLYNDPNITPEELIKVFMENIKDKHIQNFILLLGQYDRLKYLPEIAELYEEMKADYEKISTVYVTSAFPMDAAVAKKLKSSLEIRLQRDVTLDFAIDKDLLGGAVIRSGDWVVDGSVRGKLEKLKQAVIS